MSATILSRLKRLEAKTEVNRLFRYGWLRGLPRDFTGEKHAVIVKHEPATRSNVEWCEFEERAGPAPPSCFEGSFTAYLWRRGTEKTYIANAESFESDRPGGI
jgi:hypothetical protein